MNIIAYGDSHIAHLFYNIPIHVEVRSIPGDYIYNWIRKNSLPPLWEHTMNDIVVFSLGEVDCRQFIKPQIERGRELKEIVDTLIDGYFELIHKSITKYKQIIIVGIIPPVNNSRSFCIERLPEHMVRGDQFDRIKFTNEMNKKIQENTIKYGYTYFYPYSTYTNRDGTLDLSKADYDVHISTSHNNQLQSEFLSLINVEKFCNSGYI